MAAYYRKLSCQGHEREVNFHRIVGGCKTLFAKRTWNSYQNFEYIYVLAPKFLEVYPVKITAQVHGIAPVFVDSRLEFYM